MGTSTDTPAHEGVMHSVKTLMRQQPLTCCCCCCLQCYCWIAIRHHGCGCCCCCLCVERETCRCRCRRRRQTLASRGQTLAAKLRQHPPVLLVLAQAPMGSCGMSGTCCFWLCLAAGHSGAAVCVINAVALVKAAATLLPGCLTVILVLLFTNGHLMKAHHSLGWSGGLRCVSGSASLSLSLLTLSATGCIVLSGVNQHNTIPSQQSSHLYLLPKLSDRNPSPEAQPGRVTAAGGLAQGIHHLCVP